MALLLVFLLTGSEQVVSQAQSFDICLQDDSNANIVLRFNSSTGDYQFCIGSVFTGKASVSRAGNVFTLQNAAADRRIIARVDTAAGNGTATLQSPPGTTRGT